MPPIHAHSTLTRETPSIIAHYPVELVLPEGPGESFVHARTAITHEAHKSGQWKTIRCRRVTPYKIEDGEGIYILDVGHSLEFDWTWEGATAFRPISIEEFKGEYDAHADFDNDRSGDHRAGLWSGEVVEVDEVEGRIYVWVSNSERAPTTGSFYIRPFEFLAFLKSLYCDPSMDHLQGAITARLHASCGGVHPIIPNAPICGLPDLEAMWRYGWGIIWGPPGTGKTTTIGKQIASIVGSTDERVLIVSTTNKATDEVAVCVGKSLTDEGSITANDGRVLRIGKSAHYAAYENSELTGLLRGTETDFLRQIGILKTELDRATTHEQKAEYRQQIQVLKRKMKDASFYAFTSPDVRVIIATSFQAMAFLSHPDLQQLIQRKMTPFTTIVIDEAGLISRASSAALSLLASRRVLFAGDPKQLAPITRMSRVLPPEQAVWLARSALSHLEDFGDSSDAVHLLQEQHRMHPDVRAVISAYQYMNRLVDGATVRDRKTKLPKLLATGPRAVWYVLDEDGDKLPSIRADRGPGNRSWYRPIARQILKSLFADPAIRKMKGLFITPFLAQCRDIKAFLSEEGIEEWTSGTVHSQQGTEADIVVFDTVNAGSIGFISTDWERLVNVGFSRAREFVILLASRAEMLEPFLGKLTDHLAPRIIKRTGDTHTFEIVPMQDTYTPPAAIMNNPESLGYQIRERQQQRPILSCEQQRLCLQKLDGGSRLVRGVAGSGKTVVLAHWLVQTVRRLKGQPLVKIALVYGNLSLSPLIENAVNKAWEAEEKGVFPWDRQVELWHIEMLLDDLYKKFRIRKPDFEHDCDKASDYLLTRQHVDSIDPIFHAMFVDEAQDLGPQTLRLLAALVAPLDAKRSDHRAINIFYDNAQNIYQRSTPRWSELGIDIQGRTKVMKESFRSTRPITEFALNVLYRLQSPEDDKDHKELVKLGLIERTTRDGKDWWTVRFNEIDGPAPLFFQSEDLDSEFAEIGNQIVSWIKDEGVEPRDIRILCISDSSRKKLEQAVAPKLEAIGIKLLLQMRQRFSEDPRAVIVTTPHSFKGYDAEIIVIAGADGFVNKREKLVYANTLYVAMTRARSILAIYGVAPKRENSSLVMKTLEECDRLINSRPKVEHQGSSIDDFEDMVLQVGDKYRDWLEKIWKTEHIEQDPIYSASNQLLAEPLFWWKNGDQTFACLRDREDHQIIRRQLESVGIQVVHLGQEIF